MPLAAVLKLAVEEPTYLPAALGRALNAWALAQIGRIDPEAAKAIHHPQGPPPLTVSDLQGVRRTGARQVCLRPQRNYWFRITALSQDAESTLRAALEAQPETKEIELMGLPLRWSGLAISEAEHPWAGDETYSALIQRHTLPAGRLRHQITLRFLTPTVFRRDGRDLFVPEPPLVFGSLLKRWNAYAPLPLPDLAREYIRDCVALRGYRLETQKVVFGDDHKQNHVGFFGRVLFDLTGGDRYWVTQMHLLAAYARYAGVGASTSVGFGQTMSMHS